LDHNRKEKLDAGGGEGKVHASEGASSQFEGNSGTAGELLESVVVGSPKKKG